MEPLDRMSCEHAGKLYPDSSLVCSHEFCMACKNGEWVELDKWPDEEIESEQALRAPGK